MYIIVTVKSRLNPGSSRGFFSRNFWLHIESLARKYKRVHCQCGIAAEEECYALNGRRFFVRN